MAKKKTEGGKTDPEPTLELPVLNPGNDPFASHHDKHQYVQKFHFDAEMFDPQNHDHQIALETILALNRGMRLEDFRYRGNVFEGEPENGILDLQWLAILTTEVQTGRHGVQIFQAQIEPHGSECDFAARILSIRTGHEGNPASYNGVQQSRWERAAKLVGDWQMPISMITLALHAAGGTDPLDVRLFVPDEPETIYNTFALQVWRQVIQAR